MIFLPTDAILVGFSNMDQLFLVDICPLFDIPFIALYIVEYYCIYYRYLDIFFLWIYSCLQEVGHKSGFIPCFSTIWVVRTCTVYVNSKLYTIYF